MSNAEGQVIHDGKIAGFVEYYGSSSVVTTRFFDTWDEVREHWRTWPKAECTCGKPPVPVLIWVEYGVGYHWPSEACLNCRAITGTTSGYDEPLDINEWPKDGHPLGLETEWTKLCSMSKGQFEGNLERGQSWHENAKRVIRSTC